MPLLDSSRERRLLWLLALTQFTVIMDFMVMMPLGPQIMHTFGIGPAAFATAVSVYSLCSGASGLLAATYVDRFDRRRLLLTVYGLFTLANLACALSGSYGMLLFARAFAGVTGGVLGSIIMAVLSDVVPPARRGASARSSAGERWRPASRPSATRSPPSAACACRPDRCRPRRCRIVTSRSSARVWR